MNPNDIRNQRQRMDSLYGAPSLKEQGYFDQGGRVNGPPTAAMEMQRNPFGREEDAFNHGPPPKDNLWFVDQVDGDEAMVMQGNGPAMKVPASVLPKGAIEGKFFDPQSGQVVDQNGGDGDERRKRMMQESEYDDDMDGG